MLDVGQGSEYVSDKWPCYIKANRGIFRIYVSACRRLEACVYEIAVLEIEVNCQGNACAGFYLAKMPAFSMFLLCSEAVVRTRFVKTCSWIFRKIHIKTPMPQSLF